MAHATAAPPTDRSLADLLADLGDIPPERVRLVPPPGTATERDVITIRERERRLYELVEGTLVEKAMGAPESVLAWILGTDLAIFLRAHDLGFCMGADGMARIAPGLVRIPDLSFIGWDQLPTHEVPQQPIFGLAPALAVEVISKTNTRAEMERKLREYFKAGVRLVWYVYPKTRTIRVYTSPRRSTLLRDGQILDGGAILPGFALPLTELFDRAVGRGGH
jgi:Uma2 family endonuclease